MSNIPPLYHWSPVRNRAGIKNYGLMPNKSSVSLPEWNAPYICLAENPYWAWQLSGGVQTGIPAWDLWQVSLSDDHKIEYRDEEPNPEGLQHYEWRVYDRIYKRGIWLVGTRIRNGDS